MADKVFAGTVVLADRIIDNGYVLAADGAVQAVGVGAPGGAFEPIGPTLWAHE